MRFGSLYDFYRSKEWEDFRKVVLMENADKHDGVLTCEYSGEPIVMVYDAIVHHKIPLTDENVNDYTISLNPDNVMVVSHRSHNLIHERFGTWTRHIYLVYGSPCAGKSSYVRENAGKHDLIVDVDEIYRAVSVNELHDKSNRLTGNVLQIRDLLLDMIKTRNGKWVSAWVIISKCRPMELERMSKSLGAEIIRIGTDRETCELRAKDRPKEYMQYIADYWREFDEFEKILPG